MADPIGPVKTTAPVTPPAARPAGEAPAAAPDTAAAPAQDAGWFAKVGDVLGSAKAYVAPSLTAIADYAAPLTGGLGSLAGWAVRVWTKSSQLKTQAFLDANLAKFSPEGQALLKKLAANGTLDMIDPGWNNLRDNLDAFLKGGGDPKVAEAVLKQIANPEATIDQSREHSCVAAALQVAIAKDNPAQYFKMAAELASTGRTTLPSGQAIAVSEKNLAWIEAQGLTGADRTDLLFQAALMDYASDGGYDVATDLVTSKEEYGTSTLHGLSPAQARKLNEALLQMPVMDVGDLVRQIAAALLGNGVAKDAAMNALEACLAEAKKGGHGGVMVVVSAGEEVIELPPGLRGMLAEEDRRIPRYHMVVVKDIQDGMVTYLDPAGQTRTEPVEAFAARICTDENVQIGYGTGTASTGASTSTRPGR